MAANEKIFTFEEFEAMDLPERCEFIEGRIYIGESEECYDGNTVLDMSPSPNTLHQRISGMVASEIFSYIRKKKGKCNVFSAPLDVKLNDNVTVQPDIFVVCDPLKMNERGCAGAPDWVIEILSPSTSKRDAVDKLSLYKENGVREYWMIDPMCSRVIVFPFEEDKNVEMYTFKDAVAAHIYKNEEEPLAICLADYFE